VSRPFVVLLAAAAAAAAALPAGACKGKGKRADGSGASGASATGGADGSAAPGAELDGQAPTQVDLSFVRGTVVAATERAGRVVPVRLDPATSAWVPLGDGSVDLFPSNHALRGGHLAIATEGPDEASHVEQLAIVRGAEVERLGPRAGAVRNPTVSRDGTVVVVETSEHGFRDLYVLDAHGKARRLTDNREGNFEPSLSPDGAHVAFSSSRDGDAEIYRAPLGGGAAARLTAFHKDDWSPQWSPRGDLIAFLSDREGPPRLFLMAPDGTGQRRATPETDPDAAEDLPRWSPDGTRLMYVRAKAGVQLLTIVGVDADGPPAQVVTPETATNLDAAWSPDGAYIVAVERPAAPTSAPPALFLLRVGDTAVVARPDTPAHIRFVRWIP
jgi:WD40 repeat protein